MNKYRIIFSPTSGTEKVANAMTKFWNEVKDIDLSKTDLDFSSISLTEEDMAVIAMPSLGGVAPQLALDRFAKMKGNQCKCAIVAVYGNRAYENTLGKGVYFSSAVRLIALPMITAVVMSLGRAICKGIQLQCR